MRITILLSLIFALGGCTSQITFDSSHVDTVIKVGEALKAPVSDFQFAIDSSWLIVLKTPDEKIQGSITKIKIHDHLIYTLDELQSKNLNVYDFNGNYVRSIGNIGKGPQELLNISDFCIYQEQIFLIDNITERIQIFSTTSGKFLKTVPLSFRPHEMGVINDNQYLFELSEYNQGHEDRFQRYNLVVTDSLFQPQTFFLSHPKTKDNSVQYISINNPFNRVKDSIYYFSTITDAVYQFSIDLLTQCVYFDFGRQYSIPTDLKYDDNKFTKYAQGHDYAYFVESPILLENYIAGILRVNKKKFFVLTDRQECFVKEISLNDYNALDPVFCIGAYGNTLISTIDDVGLQQFKAKNLFSEQITNHENYNFILFSKLK